MNSKTRAFLAAGNLPAAIYSSRHEARTSRRKIQEETTEVDFAKNDPDHPAYACALETLKTFIPSIHKKKEMLRWLYKATEGELTTCKIGLATAGGGLVSWSYRTRVSRNAGPIKGEQIIFTGKFIGLPIGTNFSKLVLTMKNGDEIARSMLDQSIKITEGVTHVSTSYALRFDT